MKRILTSLALCAILPAGLHAQKTFYGPYTPGIHLGSTDTQLKSMQLVSVRTSSGMDTASMNVDIIQGAGLLESITAGGAWAPTSLFEVGPLGSTGAQWTFTSPRLETFSLAHDARSIEQTTVVLIATGSIKPAPAVRTILSSPNQIAPSAFLSAGSDPAVEMSFFSIDARRSGSTFAGTLVLGFPPQLASVYQPWYEDGTAKPVVITFATLGVGGVRSPPYVALTANARPIASTQIIVDKQLSHPPNTLMTFALTDVRFTKSPPAAVTLAPLALTATGVKPPEKTNLPPADVGTVRVALPSGDAMVGTASFMCQVAEGKTMLGIAFGGESGLLGAISGTVPRAAAGTYEIAVDEDRGISITLARTSNPAAVFPANAGTVTITEWTKDVLKGSFRYTGQTEDVAGVTHRHTITGSFNATRGIGCG